MLYQDRLTGMLHEVPEGQVQGYAETPEGVGEGQMVYDGLGNPLGWGFLKKLVKTVTPFASAIPGPWGLVASRALPMINRAMASCKTCRHHRKWSLTRPRQWEKCHRFINVQGHIDHPCPLDGFPPPARIGAQADLRAYNHP
jgi:hypothetical protein